jgi:hypothetical protein
VNPDEEVLYDGGHPDRITEYKVGPVRDTGNGFKTKERVVTYAAAEAVSDYLPSLYNPETTAFGMDILD